MLFGSSGYHRKGTLKNATSILYSPSPFERERNQAAPAREAADDSPSRIFRYASRKTFLSVSSPRFRGVHFGSSLKSRIAFVYCASCQREPIYEHSSCCQKCFTRVFVRHRAIFPERKSIRKGERLTFFSSVVNR